MRIPCLLFILGCCVSSIRSELELFRGGDQQREALDANAVEKDILDRTVDLIQKRAYYYATSGPGKRLPNYDFGLGKRSRGYKFGLGKRSGDDSFEDYDTYNNEIYPMRLAYLENAFNNNNNKRSAQYRLAAGKEQQQRRSTNPRYNFGLGKR